MCCKFSFFIKVKILLIFSNFKFSWRYTSFKECHEWSYVSGPSEKRKKVLIWCSLVTFKCDSKSNLVLQFNLLFIYIVLSFQSAHSRFFIFSLYLLLSLTFAFPLLSISLYLSLSLLLPLPPSFLLSLSLSLSLCLSSSFLLSHFFYFQLFSYSLLLLIIMFNMGLLNWLILFFFGTINESSKVCKVNQSAITHDADHSSIFDSIAFALQIINLFECVRRWGDWKSNWSF